MLCGMGKVIAVHRHKTCIVSICPLFLPVFLIVPVAEINDEGQYGQKGEDDTCFAVKHIPVFLISY